MRILLSGASGRVGTNLTKELLARGHQVRGMVFPGDPKADKLDAFDIEIANVGLDDTEGIAKAAEGIDAVVHTACVMSRPPTMEKFTYYDINTTGTLRLLQAVAEQGDKLHRFVHISSDTVYPMPSLLYAPVDEQHPRLPIKEYGMIKVLNEEMVEHYRREYGLKTTIIRPGAILAGEEIFNGWTAGIAAQQYREASVAQRGPLWHPEMAENVAKLDEAVKQRTDDPSKLLVNYHDRNGNPWLWQRTDARDVVHGIVQALEEDGAIGETLNMHGPYAIPFSEGTAVLSDLLGLPVLDWEAPACWQYWADNSRAKSLVKYAPQQDFHRMIADAVALREGKETTVIPA